MQYLNFSSNIERMMNFQKFQNGRIFASKLLEWRYFGLKNAFLVSVMSETIVFTKISVKG